MAQVFDRAQRMFAALKRRAAHREDRFVHQRCDLESRPNARAITHGQVDVLAREVDQAGIRIDADIDSGMLRDESFEPRHQPFRREGRRNTDNELVTCPRRAGAGEHGGEQIETFPCGRQHRLRRLA
jgi:hypothetical protein